MIKKSWTKFKVPYKKPKGDSGTVDSNSNSKENENRPVSNNFQALKPQAAYPKPKSEIRPPLFSIQNKQKKSKKANVSKMLATDDELRHYQEAIDVVAKNDQTTEEGLSPNNLDGEKVTGSSQIAEASPCNNLDMKYNGKPMEISKSITERNVPSTDTIGVISAEVSPSQKNTDSVNTSREDSADDEETADIPNPKDALSPREQAQEKQIFKTPLKVESTSTLHVKDIKKKKNKSISKTASQLFPKKLNFTPPSKLSASAKRALMSQESPTPIAEQLSQSSGGGLLSSQNLSPTLMNDKRLRLLRLQKKRDVGVWVQCTDCAKWRYLPDVRDPLTVHKKWNCPMNSDPQFNSCLNVEDGPTEEEQEDLIDSPYTAGSVVWARVSGYPWWPAMIDDDPDYEQFYWLDDESSQKPTYYSVVFFDSTPVTRAWVTPRFIITFTGNETNKRIFKTTVQGINFSKRLEVAQRQAKQALSLSVDRRLKQFSFVARYEGNIGQKRRGNSAEQSNSDMDNNDDDDLDTPTKELLKIHYNKRNLESDSDEDRPKKKKSSKKLKKKKIQETCSLQKSQSGDSSNDSMTANMDLQVSSTLKSSPSDAMTTSQDQHPKNATPEITAIPETPSQGSSQEKQNITLTELMSQENTKNSTVLSSDASKKFVKTQEKENKLSETDVDTSSNNNLNNLKRQLTVKSNINAVSNKTAMIKKKKFPKFKPPSKVVKHIVDSKPEKQQESVNSTQFSDVDSTPSNFGEDTIKTLSQTPSSAGATVASDYGKPNQSQNLFANSQDSQKMQDVKERYNLNKPTDKIDPPSPLIHDNAMENMILDILEPDSPPFEPF